MLRSNQSYDISTTSRREVAGDRRKVGDRLSEVGDWLLEVFDRRKVVDVASTATLRLKWVAGRFFGRREVVERSATDRRLVCDWSPTGCRWLLNNVYKSANSSNQSPT